MPRSDAAPSRPTAPAVGQPVAPSAALAFGPFVLDTDQARLTRDGMPVALNGRPLQVLALLAAHPGRLLDKDAVLDAVWGHRHVTESVLKGAVNLLRTALGDDARTPRYVETVPRRGYRFVADVASAGTAPAAPGPVLHAEAPADASIDPVPADALIGHSAGDALIGRAVDDALIGRAADVARLADLLRSHRLVTLTGPGGVGKTRLALAVAGTDAPPDGAWLVRLDSLADPALLVPSIAQALRLGAGAAAGVPALGQALASLQLRLVLDNAEHLVDAVAALVQALLAVAPGLRLLVTSQRPLRLAAEQVLPLPPLALPADLADAAPPAEGYAAGRLLCARVRQALPGWTPTPAEDAGIAAICRGLDGVPLGLELAAARVPLLGIDGVRRRLDQRFQLLTRGPRDAAERHRTLGAALDWTCSLLAPAEQRALQQLAVFSGGFTADAAEAVLADAEGPSALDLVEALRDLSLVVAEPGTPGTSDGPRLRLFDSVRRHALDRLAERGGETDARDRHLAWASARFAQAETAEFDTPLLQWLPPLRAELDNLRAALDHGLRPGATPAQRALAQRATAASAMFWARSGQRREGLQRLQAALAQPAAPQEATLLDHAHGLFVNFAQVGVPSDAVAALRRARLALQAAGDVRRTYLSLYAERMLLYRVAPTEGADIPAAMQALQQPHWGALARRHAGLLQALARRDAGDMDGYIADSLAMAAACRAAGGLAESWPMRNSAAQGLALQGRWQDAADVLDGAVAEVRAQGLLREQVPLLAMAACVHLRAGTPAGPALATEAAGLLRAEAMLWWMADALPWAAWHAGRPVDALRLQAWANALAQARGDARGPLFSTMRQDLGAAAAARPDAAALAAAAATAPVPDEASALALALGAG